MSDEPEKSIGNGDNRREFIRGSSILLAAALPGAAQASAVAATPRLRVGLIGCGRSGLRHLKQALQLEEASVRAVALADVFPDRVQQCVRNLKGRFPDQFDVDATTRFTGLDAYEKLLGVEMDIVILAASPAFRPLHLQAATRMGRRVVMLNPLSADLAGAESVLACLQSVENDSKYVAIGVGDEPSDAALERVRNGMLGSVTEIVSEMPCCVEAYRSRSKKESDFEFRLRNSSRFPALTGPPMVKQHVDHARLAERLFGSNLQTCHVQSPAVSVPGYITSRIRLEFESGEQLVSHCRMLPEQMNAPRKTRLVGSRYQFDLVSGRLLDGQGQVVRRIGQPAGGSISPLQQTVLSIFRNEPSDSGMATARCHLSILRSLSEFQHVGCPTGATQA